MQRTRSPWAGMAAGGIGPDEDVRLVVLPPPFMVESLTDGQVDGFCVGAPWNSMAVDQDVGTVANLADRVVDWHARPRGEPRATSQPCLVLIGEVVSAAQCSETDAAQARPTWAAALA